MFSIELYSGYISLVIFLVTLVLLIVWGTRRPEGLPPGPTPLPIVGNIPSVLKSDTRRAFAELRDQYGDVFSLVIGNAVLVVVNGLETMKEMFIKNGNIFSERPTNLGYSSLTKGLGVINSNGQKWKEQRRFALTTLRDFGMGRAEMEERIAVECQVCLNIIEEHNGTPFDPSRLLMCCVSNVISSVLFGKSFPHDDKDFVFHLDAVESSAKILGNASFAHFFPIYKYFILRSLTKTDNYVRHGIIGRELKEHLESYDENNLRDFIDAYIKECKQFEKDGIQNSFHCKRMCLGESLARMELFIFITTMVQSFTFTLPDTQPTPCLQGILGITRMPHHYKIIATKRW